MMTVPGYRSLEPPDYYRTLDKSGSSRLDYHALILLIPRDMGLSAIIILERFQSFIFKPKTYSVWLFDPITRYHPIYFSSYRLWDLHEPGGPAGRTGTSRAEAGRAHKPTTWNGPGRAGLSHPTGRAGPGRAIFDSSFVFRCEVFSKYNY